ncbi:MAG: DUF2085 domain-containing protein [Anaerolineae bacterium]|nr:DUF2085 domain-containing protein [Anaerolineae bacterium]
MSNELSLSEPRFSRYHHLMVIISFLIIAVLLLFPPVTVLDKTHAVGYAICHQIPGRTIHIDGHPLPLCARCTGIYLGALLGLVGLTLFRRYRAVGLPALPVLLTLIGFIMVMGIDGLNSYLSLFPKAPYLYEPHNWLRLTTGTFHGLAMSVIVFPVINGALWRASETKDEPVMQNFKDLLPYLGGAVIIILIVLWQHPLLLYPLAILSTGGVMLMLGIVNTMFVLIITRREGYARTWHDIVLPLTMGLALAFLMIGGMDWLRASLTRAVGIPF